MSCPGIDGGNNSEMRRSMDTVKRHSFLLKAQEAEQEATRARDPAARATWLTIAKNYRLLAEEKAD